MKNSDAFPSPNTSVGDSGLGSTASSTSKTSGNGALYGHQALDNSLGLYATTVINIGTRIIAEDRFLRVEGLNVAGMFKAYITASPQLQAAVKSLNPGPRNEGRYRSSIDHGLRRTL